MVVILFGKAKTWYNRDMNLDPNISFFQFSCEDARSSDIAIYLSNLPELECEYFSTECFTLPEDKKMLPEYLKKVSKDLPDVEFVHTYSFPLANTMGYSIFKNGEVTYQHRECLTDRITKVNLHEIKLKASHISFDFIYEHFEYPLDFDSKPQLKKFQAQVLKEDIEKLKSINFQETLKEILNFNSEELAKKQIDNLVVDKVYTILKQDDIQTQINYLSLAKKLKQKVEKSTVQKI
jgi:hypothetical protein